MNLSRTIERHAQFSPERVVLHFEGEDIRYPQLWERVCVATVALVVPRTVLGKVQKSALVLWAQAS